jgi:hypothetical protein
MGLTRINKTGRPEVIAGSDGRLTISVPIQLNRRSGRKLVTLPGWRARGNTTVGRRADAPPGWRSPAGTRGWPRSGEVNLLRELARSEGVDSSYVSRMVNLTTLAPDIVATILDEALPPDLTLFDLAVDPPAPWEGQRRRA